MRIMKEQKGITLIALVVTIVVLLILAGITITMLLDDNGIISTARRADNETELATVKTCATMAISTLTAHACVPQDGVTAAEVFKKSFPSDMQVTVNDSDVVAFATDTDIVITVTNAKVTISGTTYIINYPDANGKVEVTK